MNQIYNPLFELNFFSLILLGVGRIILKSKALKIFFVLMFFICYFNTNVKKDVDPCYVSYQIVKIKYKWIYKSLYDIIYHNSIKNNLDPLLICSLINVESEGKKYAISCVGAKGYMQLMDVHTKGVNPFDTRTNIILGTKEFRKCIYKAKYKYGRDIYDSLRMYNQGRFGKRENYKNWKYVYKIMRHYKTMLLANN